jgi:hypothetical protein
MTGINTNLLNCHDNPLNLLMFFNRTESSAEPWTFIALTLGNEKDILYIVCINTLYHANRKNSTDRDQ